MHPPRVWLITGASSGLGKALTEVVLSKGDIVVATLRKPSVLAPLTKKYPPTQLLLLPLDVTCPSDVTAAFTRTQEVFGRLDVVFNNAGRAMTGEVESTPDADARALFEVNFWGMVCILQTGGFETNVFASGLVTPLHPAYTNTLTAALRAPYKNMRPDGDPNKFAEMLYLLVIGEGDGDKIPLFLPIGKDTLKLLQDKLRKRSRVLVDARPWSVDLKKDKDKAMAKL
ncbi:hypothetical protein HD554DRAFT_2172701 [Boletus coccyginus]|nr:hypothetical protein HD554DRAFT_2172701 [Boletus coccyginus]